MTYSCRVCEAVFMDRDGFRCVWCKARQNLEVDHIKPFAYYPELRLAESNGRTLCHECHTLTDTYKKRRPL